MDRITTRFPTDDDVIFLGQNLRQSDIDEIEAVCDLTPIQAVELSAQCADPRFLFAAFAGQQLLAIGGVSHTGAPWLLATQLMDKYAFSLTKRARNELKIWAEYYPHMTNVVDVRQKNTIAWLQAIGFEISDTPAVKPGFNLARFTYV